MSGTGSVHLLTVNVALMALLISGCARSDPSHANSFDKRVFQDVVAATYPIPGSEIRRGMRVKAFMRGLAIKQCGGTPGPVDGTTDRYAQDLFPDLDLISSRGFADGLDPATSVDPDCVLIPKSIPSYVAWMTQGAEWQDLASRIQKASKALAPLKPLMAACLRRRSGLTVKSSDPTSFLYSVDVADQKGASRAQYMAWSDAYADCGRQYFAALASELAIRRPDVVKRNGELMRSLAAEVEAAGYRP